MHNDAPAINRVSSGAQIKIAGNEGDGSDRLVTITGTPEAVGMAQYLINSRYAAWLLLRSPIHIYLLVFDDSGYIRYVQNSF